MTSQSAEEDAMVGEILKLLKKVPKRPSVEDVSAAKTLIKTTNKDDESKRKAINEQTKTNGVSEELFSVFLEMQKAVVRYESEELKKEAVKVLDLESAHRVFDELIQKAYRCVSIDSRKKMAEFGGESGDNAASSSSVKSEITSAVSAQDEEKLTMVKLVSLIEVSAKYGTEEIDLSNKLSEQIKLLPNMITKLSSLITLDLSGNRIVALPATFGALSLLTKLDLHGNRISELPESIGQLSSLVHLDLRGNDLNWLPKSIGGLISLEVLDVSANRLSSLPLTIESLVRLKKLNAEFNLLEHLPPTILKCSVLQELHVRHNQLKNLLMDMGNLRSLEILSLQYNKIRQLPGTMSAMNNLRELDVSFNELEEVPDILCRGITRLTNLNISGNFADLQSLPSSFGSLEYLEVLDMRNNQIRVLPHSFGTLSRLHTLYADHNPLEVPPKEIVAAGAQAVVQYMADYRPANRGQLMKKTVSRMFCFKPSN